MSGVRVRSTRWKSAVSSLERFAPFHPDPLAAIDFANYSRAVEHATKTGGEVVKIAIEHGNLLGWERPKDTSVAFSRVFSSKAKEMQRVMAPTVETLTHSF